MPEHFKTVEVATGVWAALDRDTGAAVSNAAIIDTGDKTVVFDCFMTAQAGEELRAEAMALTGRDAFLVVNSHWHSDHVRGNQAFAGTPIISTQRTVELITADAPADLSAYEAELDGAIAAMKQRLESEDDNERKEAARQLGMLDHLKQAAPGLRLTLPDELIHERRHPILGERSVELLTHGPGHTESDVFAWIPSEKAVIGGDLCWNRVHPRTNDGDPKRWAETLRRILDLGPEVIVPGHGRHGDREVAEALIPYLEEVAHRVDQVRAGADPAAMEPPPGSEGWQGPQRLSQGITALAAR